MFGDCHANWWHVVDMCSLVTHSLDCLTPCLKVGHHVNWSYGVDMLVLHSIWVDWGCWHARLCGWIGWMDYGWWINKHHFFFSFCLFCMMENWSAFCETLLSDIIYYPPTPKAHVFCHIWVSTIVVTQNFFSYGKPHVKLGWSVAASFTDTREGWLL